jgi:DNA-binding response OmpR family regulator/anti-anti-sigma regulatory factor
MTRLPLILIVDDDPNNLQLISDILSELSVEVSVESNGMSALEQISREPPDLILMDVQMPIMDGFDACERLKANPSTSHIPVIFMTALADRVDKLKGLSLGAIDYITRPFDQGELLARVQVHLQLRTLTKTLEEQNARLKSEIEERAAAEAALQKLTQDLKAMNVRLQAELAERERSEQERTALQQEIIRVQSARLQEMATPLIPLTDGIMVMPLIGTLDTERAQQVLSMALHGAQKSRAKVVIIDITGVKGVDAAVATTLVSTAGALRLLGTQAVLTGIGAEVAQTLVRLGIHLDTIVTRGTLQDGIAHALSLSKNELRRR